MTRLLCLLLLALSASAQDRYPVDWGKLAPEILERFSELIRIDTTNPPGNETAAAKVLQAALEREGVATQLLTAEPGRANLVARIRGSGARKPLLLMGHTDVVGVQRANWTVDPFAAVIRNGRIYGRGAQDDKPHVLAGLMTMLLLQRLHVKLDRDVIFLAEAGEEGTTAAGIDFLVKQHWPLIEAEFAFAEGGSAVEQAGKVRQVLVSTTEKVPRGIRLVARGQAGHGSRPIPNNAVVHLAEAAAKAGNWRTPMRLIPTTRAYFERLAAVSPPETAARYRAILDPARAAEADRWFAQHEPGHYSILRTSVVPTILRAGFRNNVIPSEAEGYLDVRALPDEDMTKFVADLRRVIGDASVEIVPPSPGGRPAAPASSVDSEAFRALERIQRRMYPGAVTLPSMLTGATDMAQLRARGVQAYGVGPAFNIEEGPAGGAHSDDENISVASLNAFVEFVWSAVIELATSR